MRRFSRQAADVAANPWFVVAGGIASILAFIAYLYEKVDPAFSGVGRSLLAGAVAFLFVGYYYSIRVRAENIALRDMAKYFYEINEIYKNRLRSSFFGPTPLSNAAELLTSEQLVLRSVCQRIENIFSRAIQRNCMVTVKLVTKHRGVVTAHTYARSQELCARDNPERAEFEVGTGQNTAFDRALLPNADGRPAHYFSADLSKESDYSNQRQHYLKYYKSTLVVPIRGERTGAKSDDADYDHIGYLCVDTLSVNRLNNRYHLYMLAALAHQMYNFISLMRGRYKVLVEGASNVSK